MAIRRRVMVHGTVQGVGFRWSVGQEAERLGVAGSVRNLIDGSVEAVAEGEQDAVDALIAFVSGSPGASTVTGVDIVEEDPQGASSFEVR